jgi:hypothetical protein
MESQLDRWLSLSIDTFKSERAQFDVSYRSCLDFDQGLLSSCRSGAHEVRTRKFEIPGLMLRIAPE